LEEELKMLAKA